jgi:hypothetical protein
LYVGEKHAYRDELSFARAESARGAVNAPRAETLDWDAKLLFRVTWDDQEIYTTDDIVVRQLVTKHPHCDVHVISVA